VIGAVLTIARRDFLATVFTRGFLVWLLMPLFGVVVGFVAASLTDDERGDAPADVVAVVDAGGTLRPWLEAALAEARTRAGYAGLRDRFRSVHPARPLPPELADLPEDLGADRLAALGRPGALEALRDRADLDFGRLGSGLPARGQPPALLFVPAADDVDAQVRRLLRSGRGETAGRRFDAVLRIDGDRERLIAAPGREPPADAVARLVNDARERRALAAARLDAPPAAVLDARRPLAVEAAGDAGTAVGRADRRTREAIGRGAALVVFMLIGLLAGVLLSNMVEEKANKVIEVLVASVPVPAIFAGKLVAMLAISAVGVAVWAALVGGGVAWVFTQVPAGLLPAPALGWPMLLALTAAYFATAYLIYGAIYLGIGSLCSSIREVQTLSMPVTVAQTVVLLGVLGAIGNPDGAWADVMSWFPLSSPYMMTARAATDASLLPHLLAIAWQLAFAALVVWYAARLFRHGVLGSGPPPGLLGWGKRRSDPAPRG